jgi:DNA helicase-2/ATP-dependent DNA helicase PcrA
VPYRVYGGLRFFERQEIKHALAYLRLIANPDDDTAFARVVNFPTRGIGAAARKPAGRRAHQMPIPASTTRRPSDRQGRRSGRQFHPADRDLRRETENLPLPEMVDHVIEKSGLRQHYLGREGRPGAAGEPRRTDQRRDQLPAGRVRHAANGEAAPLASFLAHASLEAGEHQAGEGQEAVQLMTVHAAKGLEFDVVFITGLEQGLFPHENSVNQERDGLEEERRLMYVAVTRARQRLYLLRADPHAARPDALLRAVDVSSKNCRKSCCARFGQNVEHAKFGLGVIVSAEGRGADARVQVNFGAHGMKWLALE